MNRKSIIQIVGMSLIILLAPFFIKQALAFADPSGSISFEVNKPISEAKYLQWEIEGATFINVTLNISRNGSDVFFGFTSSEVEDEVRRDRLYITFPGDNKTYESGPFEDLISLFLSENSDSDYEVPDEIKIKRIDVFVKNSIKFYSIALTDNEDFDGPCWRKDARNWRNNNDFLLDGGSFTHADIRFYTSYIQASKVVGSSSPDYSSWSMSNIGWNQPSYDWNMPYNYGWNQPSYVWNQPSYGWNQQFYNPYSYQQSYNPDSYQQSYNPDSYQQSYNPYGYGYQQSYNPYSYQQSYNPYGYGYQQSYNPYSYQQLSYNPYGYGYQQSYNGNSNPYPSPYGPSGPDIMYVGYPPPTPDWFYSNI